MSLTSNLYALGALMKDNLEYKGITGLTGNEGLTTLANKIRDITCKKEERGLILTFTGDSVSFGENIVSNGEVLVDWGDGSTATIDNFTSNISHTYNDGLAEHTVVLTGEITSLGEFCFSFCFGLTSVIIPDSVTTLGGGCFTDCSALTSVIIPDSVTTLGNYCFENCFGLTSVIIPDSVTTLGNYCFSFCSTLTSVIIPDSVTTLGKNCFENCFGLTSVIIPDSVTTLDENCFLSCSGLIDYELYWESSPISYDSYKMPNNTNAFFHIPPGTKTEYINKGYPANKLVERGVNLYISIVDENKNKIEPIVTNGQKYYVRLQLLNEGFPVPNQPITLRGYIDNIEGEYDNSVTYATDGNGIIDIEMIGESNGVITYEASCNFYTKSLQETFVVWDTLFYDHGLDSDYNPNWENYNNHLNIARDTIGTLLTNTSGNNGYLIATRTPPSSFTVEFDVIDVDGSVSVAYYSQSTDRVRIDTRSTSGDTVKIEYNDGENKVYVNEELVSTITTSNKQYISLRLENNASFKYKNLKVYTMSSGQNLTLSSDKDILSNGESATITALLTNNNVPVRNVELEYRVEHNNTIIDSGTLTTDSNGEANLIYTGTGIGEVEITVKYGIFLQETFVIKDCLMIDNATLSDHNDIWLNTTQSGVNFERKAEYTEFAITTSANKYISLNLSLNSQNMIIEFDVLFNTVSNGAFADIIYQNNRVSSINLQNVGAEDNVWIPVKLVLNNGTITLMNRNTSQSKVLAENSNWDSFRFLNYSVIDKTTLFKNFKVYSA